MRFEKVIPEKNQFRYYEITLDRDLLDEASILVKWGRIGRPGRSRIVSGGKMSEAEEIFDLMKRVRFARGYKLCEKVS